MRSALWGIVVAGSTLAGGLTLGAACGSLPDDCVELYACALGSGGSPSSASSSSSSSASSSSGTGGGPPSTCVPTAGMDPVDDTCGIFVSSSQGADSASAGSKAKPYKTLAAAITAAGAAKKPVYACSETFSETLTVAVGVGVYGGLDCTKGWSYAGDAKSTLTTDADAVPLTLSATANGASLFDFTVQAADAMLSGGSSIAVIADQVTAAFTRCDFIAGNGKDGLPGIASTVGVGPTSDSTDPLIRGNDGTNACASAVQSLGGAIKENALCPIASGGPIGGAGGLADTTQGYNGGAIPASPLTALGGQGETSAGWGCFGGSGLADGGANGQAGLDGLGAAGLTSLGTLAISGYVGASGAPGDLGKAGQGGAGGGGAKGKAGCAGASGGGGGAGGCGGHGGTGGQAGGASIALLSLTATFAFDTVTVKLGAGGAGGDGGDGQDGGVGGFGGFGGKAASGILKACDGGGGGQGGRGGKGGGGRGGHAIGIAATGTKMVDTIGITFLKKGTPGPGGKGGPMNDGEPGVQANVQLFP
jgi:hypothetical protein